METKNKVPKYIEREFTKAYKIILTDIEKAINGTPSEFGYISIDEYALAFAYLTHFLKYHETQKPSILATFFHIHDNLEQSVMFLINLPQTVYDWLDKLREKELHVKK